ncbi:hypothetical protein DPMN_060571 [Dreissena polymorpha]|uniref:B box-type domain-containing protein n=1 Tax=Dreissena polymorpha TaxID=45954 RepID=A0A9D4C5U8_DREPO|nr:hypothetical protein DPMN_060571 [Dreissena polymorpha]
MAFAASDEDAKDTASESCEPCMSYCKEITATVYCLDCDEKFCEACGNCHKKSKLSKDHKLSKIEEAPPSHVVHLMKELTTCPNHQAEEVVYVCVDEDKLCCNQCANTQHRQCKRLDTIEQYMTNPTVTNPTERIEKKKTSTTRTNWNQQSKLQDTNMCEEYVKKTVDSNESIMAKLNEFQSQLQGIIAHEISQRAFVEENSKCVSNYLEIVHAKFESAFNTLQNELIVQSEQQTKDLLRKISNQETSAADLCDQVKRDQENMNAIKQHGQEKHIFLLSRKMSGTLKDIETKTQKLERQKTEQKIKVVERSSIDGIVRSISTALEVKQKK